MTLLGIIGATEIIMILTFLFFMGIIPLIALIDIIRSDFKGENDKLIWVLLVIFTVIIGAILYFAIGRRQKISRE